MKNYFWVCLIIFAIGMWLRVDCYGAKHPDQDELFELNSIKDKQLSSVFDNKAFYGDHTSFPGELLIYYLPMKMVLDNPSIDVGKMTVTGMGRNDFLKLAVPKILMFIASFWLLYLICRDWMAGWGIVVAMTMYGFNYQLVYHAFELRPYSVLPFLAILNFFMSTRRSGLVGDIFHTLLIFFTCIYHAYGPMIALFPMFFMKDSRPVRILCVVPFALAGWAYYAFYSHFGMSPNKMQSVVDTFQYMPKQLFFENLLRQLSGGSLIFYAIIPLLGYQLLRGLILDSWLILILLVILPIVLICLVDIKTHYWIHPRQYIWVIPFFALFCGKIVNDITSVNRE